MMKRGEIWWAALDRPRGSEPGYRRPVLIVQANAFNESRIATVLVAVISSNLALAEAPGNVCIGKADSKLAKASVANVSQLLTLDRRYLSKRISLLPSRAMSRVTDGLRLVLGI
jgi:mRNA interferase MazF